MDLSYCRHCGQQVSKLVGSCPYCGASFPLKSGWNKRGFEWKSESSFMGYPLVHVAFGRDEQGRIRVAKGIIAVGQFAIGLITIAQFGIGILFGLGQFIIGFMAIAQFAAGLYFALGQFAAGYIAIGQIAVGNYARCQLGLARYLWSQGRQDPEAVEFFKNFFRQIGL